MARSHLFGSNLPDAPAYGGHSIYLFSTLDDPTEESPRTPSPILPPNRLRQKTGGSSSSTGLDGPIDGDIPSAIDDNAPSDHEDVQMDESGDQEEREEEEEQEEDDIESKYSNVPLILPRRSFKGISNLRTIKDGEALVAWQGMRVTDGSHLQSTLSDPMMSSLPLVPMMVISFCGEEKTALYMGYTRAMGAL